MSEINLSHSQAGIIGDNAHVEGGIYQTTIYEGVGPISAGTLLQACQAQVRSMIHAARQKYDPELYINRAIEQDLRRFFDTPLVEDDPNCFLIVAPAGSGKTNLLCHLARQYVESQPALLLMGGNTYISSSTGLLGAIQAELEAVGTDVTFRSAGDSLHYLHGLATEIGRDTLLFLDAINEHDQPAEMRKAVEDLLRKTHGKRIKLVVTCRDYYWEFFKSGFGKAATVNGLSVDEDETDAQEEGFNLFTVDEHKKALDLYLKHYKIKGRLVGRAAEQCRSPLLLRFFCEAYQNERIDKFDDIRLKELFDLYWERKIDSVADQMITQDKEHFPVESKKELKKEVGNYLLDVAAYMLHHNVRIMTVSEMSHAAQSSTQCNNSHLFYVKIRGELIILEEKQHKEDQGEENCVVFVYEEFMEYVMARSLIRDWERARLNREGILSSVEKLTEKYTEFAQILGVMVYLAVMLRGDRDLALWRSLLRKGRHWDQVILESIRKLKKDKLDERVYDVLGEMLSVRDRNTQRKVLDVLEIEEISQGMPQSMANTIFLFLKDGPGEILWQPAIRLLGQIWDLPGLAQLGDLRYTNRLASIDTVTQHLGKNDNIIYPLIIALKYDKVSQVREKIAEALGRIDDQRVREPMIAALKRDKSWKVREKVVEMLSRLGDWQAIELLITTLEHDESPRVREAAAQGFASVGDPQQVTEVLIAKLESDRDGQVREKVVELLMRHGDQRAVEPLIAAVRDPEVAVRYQAIKGLGILGDKKAVKPLLDLLLADSISISDRISRPKTSQGDKLPASAPKNERYVPFKWENTQLKCQAAISLGMLNDERAILPLINLLMTGDSELVQCASQALGVFWCVPALAQLGRDFWHDWQKVSGLLRRLSAEQTAKLLIALIKNDNPDTRYKAALKLKQLEAACALQPFVETLKDSDWRMQETAAQALGTLGNKWAVGKLISILRDETSHWRVRCAAADSLGKLGDTKAVKSLIGAFDSRHLRVQKSAIRALVELCGNPEARSCVLQHLNKSWQLANWPQLMEGNYRDRMKAIRLLSSLTDSLIVVPLVLGLEDRSKNVQLTAANVLKTTKSILVAKLLSQYGYE